MALRLFRAILLATLFASAPSLAFAQDDPHATRPKPKLPEAPAKLPKVDRGKNLDFLFGALKAAPDEASAKHVEARIWAIWLQTPSDTAALLMARAKTAVDTQKIDVAIKLLDSVIKLRPDYIEAWNRRAILYWEMGKYQESIADCKKVVALNPSHFGAWQGMGLCQLHLGQVEQACQSFRAALRINPHDSDLRRMLEQAEALLRKLSPNRSGTLDWV